MDGLKYVKMNLASLDKRSNIEQKRVILFSSYTYIILSKEIYENNPEIRKLISNLNLDFKDYVFRSRTTVVARLIRILEKAPESDINFYLDTIMEILFNNISSGNRKKSTSISDTISKFVGNDIDD